MISLTLCMIVKNEEAVLERILNPVSEIVDEILIADTGSSDRTKEIAGQYTQKAKEMAVEWERMANDGDHYKLTFDKSGTWSQKYNLVWDKLMNWQIFPEQIVKTEIPYYLTKQNRYGLPLDNRQTYTKTDWIMWTATLAPDKATFEEFIEPVYLFMNETTDRIPMSDWVFTDKPEHRAFQARSVVGGYFIKMLENKMNN